MRAERRATAPSSVAFSSSLQPSAASRRLKSRTFRNVCAIASFEGSSFPSPETSSHTWWRPASRYLRRGCSGLCTVSSVATVVGSTVVPHLRACRRCLEVVNGVQTTRLKLDNVAMLKSWGRGKGEGEMEMEATPGHLYPVVWCCLCYVESRERWNAVVEAVLLL